MMSSLGLWAIIDRDDWGRNSCQFSSRSISDSISLRGSQRVRFMVLFSEGEVNHTVCTAHCRGC